MSSAPAPLLPNVVISTTRAGMPVLATLAAALGVPGPKDQDPAGGIITYVGLVAADTDLRVADIATILSWNGRAVPVPRRYRVVSADMSGNFGLEVLRIKLAEWVGR